MDRTVRVQEETGLDFMETPPRVQVISVTSGKGGVGKTNVVVNLGITFARAGKRVLILDADLGLGNLDVLLGLVPSFTLEHVLRGEKRLQDIILSGPRGIKILPAGSGGLDMTRLTPEQQVILQDELDQLASQVDLMLIDTGAGISPNVLFFAVAAQEIVVVVTPEPTSMTDAYAVMKVLSRDYSETRFRLLVNMARSSLEAVQVYRKICRAADRFLNVSIDYVGYIPIDEHVPLAVWQQRAVVEMSPQAPASRAMVGLARTIHGWGISSVPKGGVQFFWQRLVAQS